MYVYISMNETNKIMKYDNAIIKNSGMGGFLNPPKHPEHDYHVSSVKRDDFSLSLSSALKASYISPNLKKDVQKLLDDWEENKLPLESDEIQDWIYQCLGYFNNCYSPDGIDRNVSNCKIIHGNPFEIGISRHLGVLCILQYYPEFEPKERHFINAYWGKKPKNIIEPKKEVFEDFESGSKWKLNGTVSIIHVVCGETPLMVRYYDSEDSRPNPKIHAMTKLSFQNTHKKL